MQLEAAHGAGTVQARPDALTFIDDYVFHLLPQYRWDPGLFVPTESEASRLAVESGSQRAVAGAVMLVAGAAACLGALPACAAGAVAVLYGADNAATGLLEVTTQSPQMSGIQRILLEDMDLSPGAAFGAELGLGVLATLPLAVTLGNTGKSLSNSTLSSVTWVDGAALAEIAANAAKRGSLEIRSVESSLGKINQIRETLNVGAKRNIAFAEYNINGQSGELVAVSGNASRPGTVGVLQTRQFETIATGNNTRILDSEVKIFEDLASRLPLNASGKVHLFSEHPLCMSCSNVVPQFQQKFPNIEVTVTHGP
jgi:hypothetical protein